MIHDLWFTFILIWMFVLVIIFRVLSIVIGVGNGWSQWVLNEMTEINKLSREN